MDKFPEDFNEGVARKVLDGKRNSDTAAQEELLCKTREQIYQQVKQKFGELVIFITIPAALDIAQAKILARELYNRFPGALHQRGFAIYHKVESEEQLGISPEFKLVF